MTLSIQTYIKNAAQAAGSGPVSPILQRWLSVTHIGTPQPKLVSQPFDGNKAKAVAQGLVESHMVKSVAAKSLKEAISGFLNQFSTAIQQMRGAANLRGATARLVNGGIHHLLAGGNSQAAFAAAKSAAGAVRKLADSYNASLSLLEDNQDRGGGVGTLLGRLLESPADESRLAMLGISRGENGALVVDEEKLAAALLAEDETLREQAVELLGHDGLAGNILSSTHDVLDAPESRPVGKEMPRAHGPRSSGSANAFPAGMWNGPGSSIDADAAESILMDMLA